MANTSKKSLVDIIRETSERSNALNKALGLSYFSIKDDNIIEIFPDGETKIIQKAIFSTIKMDKKSFYLSYEK